ncbi:glutathione S-transferase [Pseudomonas duriflava]|uniref:Glutathione S-transferase n=1 Tax=Pseudomonas duriflava TaxID=459528 RepID=A0A562PX02_9PSED|nr:glutathione S-transferase family protein [Pseudomonas duriflava]TWI48982.1 glutathione S-transferase [Pseudomonas duriflava]
MNLHIFGPGFSTFVRSVRLYCEEKGLQYTYGMELNGQAIAFRSPEHLELHPFGKVPVLFHEKHKVFETTTICRYLDDAFPDMCLCPEDPYEKANVNQWANALALYADYALVRRYLLVVAPPVKPASTPCPAELINAEQKAIQMLAKLEEQLGDHACFCGATYSMADAILTPILDYLERLPGNAVWVEQQLPKLCAYLLHMRSRRSGLAVLS